MCLQRPYARTIKFPSKWWVSLQKNTLTQWVLSNRVGKLSFSCKICNSKTMYLHNVGYVCVCDTKHQYSTPSPLQLIITTFDFYLSYHSSFTFKFRYPRLCTLFLQFGFSNAQVFFFIRSRCDMDVQVEACLRFNKRKRRNKRWNCYFLPTC